MTHKKYRITVPGCALSSEGRRRAAAYVRMSTDLQQYSTDNQLAAIRAYAEKNGLEIVRVYADEGKSGMQAKGRDAFLDMIHTIEDGEADFAAVIVYDHSRWGRFQIPHESERYAWVCANAGIDIHLCIGGVPEGAEHLGAVIWSPNSYGSGEFLRVLSAKVHAGHCNLVRLGFRQGGPAGYGLRRVLLNDKGHIKQELKRGDRKSLQTERVVLRPGPQAEVRRVRWMYEQFASHGLSESGIAAELNAKGILTDFGRPWTSATVHQVLTNEKYIGNNLYNRTSAKLTAPRRANAPEDWVRADSAFPSIVPHDLFLTVRQIITERNRRYSNEELLERLASLFHQRGTLSGLIIDEAEDMPPASAYQSRFGSLIRAYEKVFFLRGTIVTSKSIVPCGFFIGRRCIPQWRRSRRKAAASDDIQ